MVPTELRGSGTAASTAALLSVLQYQDHDRFTQRNNLLEVRRLDIRKSMADTYHHHL